MNQIPNSWRLKFRTLLVIGMFAPGIIIYVIYKITIWLLPDIALGLFSAKDKISGIVAGASFAMLGFLATIITLIIAITGTEAFLRYRRRGYLADFFFLYRLTIVNLSLTGLLALAGFAHAAPPGLFHFILVMFVNSVIQVATVAFIISNLSHNAIHSADDRSSNPP